MKPLLLVCLGGALGSGARYLVSSWLAGAIGSGFPYGTLAVNAVGSFLVAVVLYSAGAVSPEVRLFLTTGVMGGFTTYSAFNYESTQLLRGDTWGIGFFYICVTLLGCLAAGLLGMVVARSLTGR